MKFPEAKLAQAFIELSGNEGYPHFVGSSVARSDDEVLIEEDLKNFDQSLSKSPLFKLCKSRRLQDRQFDPATWHSTGENMEEQIKTLIIK